VRCSINYLTFGSGDVITGYNATAYSSSAATSVTGTIFIDNDGLGQTDSSNPGLSGVTVSLETTSGGSVTNASGGTVSSTTTNSSGNYSFTNLNPGTYQVVVTQPTGYSLEGSTTSTWSTLVNAPGSYTTVNEGVYQPASMSGTVSYGSGGLSGVTIYLMDTNGNVLSTTSASNGTYSFSDDLAPGLYELEMVAPSGYVFNGTSNILSNFITIGSDQSLTGQNATAYSSTAATSITGTVFSDADGTGIPYSSNPNLSGITVTLETTSGGSVTNASGGTVSYTTTNSSGVYTFSNLNPGSYQVVVTAPTGYVAESTYGTSETFAAVAPGTGSTVNGPMIQDGGFSGNVSENNGFGETAIYDASVVLQDASGDTVASTTTDSSGNFSLSNIVPGIYTSVFTAPSGYILNGSSNTWSETVDIDSGVTNSGNNISAYSSMMSTSISGTVVIDNDGSNYNDGTNPGISGVTVTLLQGTTTISSTTTNSSGNYSFNFISPGTYTVQVSEPSGYSLEGSSTSTYSVSVSAPGPVTTADEAVYQTGTLGGTVSVSGGSGLSGVAVTLYDTNFDQIATTTTVSGGTFSFTGIVPGTYFMVYAAPSGYVLDGSSNTLFNTVTVGSDQTISTLNATAYSASGTYSLSSTVFIDALDDGTDDSGDSGLSGVTVTLLDSSGNPVLNSSGDPITTTTNSSGQYTFSGLNPDSYQVGFAMASGSSYVTDGSGTSAWTGSASLPGPSATLNAGVYVPSTFSGNIFLDSMATGTTGGGNSAEADIAVTVLNSNGLAVATTTTDSSGNYSFTGPAGTYSLQLGIQSDAVVEGSAGKYTAPIAVASGATLSNINVGVVQPPSSGGLIGDAGNTITGFAWSDTSGNGLRSQNSSGVDSVTVKLLNQFGTVLDTVLTNSAGFYELPTDGPGTYQLQFIIPLGDSSAAFSTQNASTDPTTSSAANAEGYTSDFTVTEGEVWLAENVGLTGIGV